MLPVTWQRIKTMPAHSIRCGIIADAMSQQDLACLARAALRAKQSVLFAGSAGLAAEVARILSPLKHSGALSFSFRVGAAPQRGTHASRGHTLVMTGTNNPVTERQLEELTTKTHATQFGLHRRTRKGVIRSLVRQRHVVIRVPVYGQPDNLITSGSSRRRARTFSVSP